MTMFRQVTAGLCLCITSFWLFACTNAEPVKAINETPKPKIRAELALKPISPSTQQKCFEGTCSVYLAQKGDDKGNFLNSGHGIFIVVEVYQYFSSPCNRGFSLQELSGSEVESPLKIKVMFNEDTTTCIDMIDSSVYNARLVKRFSGKSKSIEFYYASNRSKQFLQDIGRSNEPEEVVASKPALVLNVPNFDKQTLKSRGQKS